MISDRTLLESYAKDGSEDAFGELVSRHIHWVHSAAVRQVGDEDLAKDVTQIVFSDLARKAGSLSKEIVLGAWLHRATCYATKRVLRQRQRLEKRDQILAESMDDEVTNRVLWVEVSKELDAALDSLSLVDRKAIILRFFERHDFRTVGCELGVTEGTAQKRVERALEKLRVVLWRRGISSGIPSLTALLGANAVTNTPPALAAGITATALSVVPVKTTGLLAFIAIMNTKTIGTALVILGLGTSLFLLRSNRGLRDDNERLRVELGRISREVENSRTASPALVANGPINDGFQSELLRLRGEVARLRRVENELRKQPKTQSSHQTQPVATLADVGTATPEDAATTTVWALTEGVRDRLPELLTDDPTVGPEVTVKRQDFLFKVMTEAFSSRVMTGIDRVRTNEDGSINVYYAFHNRETGESNNVSFLLRASPHGWRVDPGPPPDGY